MCNQDGVGACHVDCLAYSTNLWFPQTSWVCCCAVQVKDLGDEELDQLFEPVSAVSQHSTDCVVRLQLTA